MSAQGSNPLLEGFMSIEEFRTSLNKSQSTIWRWRRRGLPTIRRGNLVLVNIESARAWLMAAERGGCEPPKRKRAR